MKAAALIAVGFLGAMGLPTAGLAASFGGYECTDDCSGHRAGYEWAASNGITDAGYCTGSSRSFVEGCMVWAEEQSTYEGDEECEEECDE